MTIPVPHTYRPQACQSEACSVCEEPAMHKVTEVILADDTNIYRHPLTAYMCCECFRLLMGGVCK